MSGADPVGEFVVGTAVGNLGLGLGKIALSKMGQNTVSHWARNSLLNETAGNLTRNVSQVITNNLAAKLDQGMVRLYRASGTNGKFTPSPDGTAKYTGMWFTDNPRKTLIYASNTRRKAIKEGVDNPIELQYIDIPKTQLNQYKASNIIGNDPNIEYEINEDFLIPLNMKRNRMPLKGITGNILRDSRLTIPKLDTNVFKIAAPIGMSLPFLNNSQK